MNEEDIRWARSPLILGTHHDTLRQLVPLVHRSRRSAIAACGAVLNRLHAADCYVCMKEVFDADTEQKVGKTSAQIRKGILRVWRWDTAGRGNDRSRVFASFLTGLPWERIRNLTDSRKE